MKPPKKLYEFHVANLQEIDRAMNRIARSLRAAISQDDEITISSFMRLYALLLGAWAECRLKKLIYEKNGFNDSERAAVDGKITRLQQWLKAVEAAFRRQYKIPKADLTEENLSHSVFSKYDTLSKMLTNDLGPIIELRNKLAHGQWKYPLNDSGDDVAQQQMDALRTENLMSLQFRKSLLESLAAAIHDLVISRPTFDRDFDNHYETIKSTRLNLRNRSYTNYVNSLRKKHQRGKIKRAQNSPEL